MFPFFVTDPCEYLSGRQLRPRASEVISDWLDLSRAHCTPSLKRQWNVVPYSRPNRHMKRLELFEAYHPKSYEEYESKVWRRQLNIGELYDSDSLTAKMEDGQVVINIKKATGDDERTEIRKVLSVPNTIDVDNLRMFIDERYDSVVHIRAPYKQQTDKKQSNPNITEPKAMKVDSEKEKHVKINETQEQNPLGADHVKTFTEDEPHSTEDQGNISGVITQEHNDEATEMLGEIEDQTKTQLSINKINQCRDIMHSVQPFRHQIQMKGFQPDDITVTVDDNQLTIVGKHVDEEENGLSMSRVEKSFTLPSTACVDELLCEMREDGTVCFCSA